MHYAVCILCVCAPISLTGVALHALVALARAGLGDEMERLVGDSLGALLAEDEEAFDMYEPEVQALAFGLRDGTLDGTLDGRS